MFSREYLELTAGLGLTAQESPAPSSPFSARRISEKAVALLWMKQPWAPNPLKDAAGKRIWIISPGWMRGGGGPDFVGALFRDEDGRTQKGDVEIHVRSSDWIRHKHHLDPAFESVRLHVVMYCDAAAEAKATSAGAPLTELAIDQAYPPWRQTLSAGPDEARLESELSPSPGRCSQILEKLGKQKSMDLLDSAGEGRLLMKSEKIGGEIYKESGETALYRGLAEALGYSAFREKFRALAMELPMSLVKQIAGEMDRKRRRTALEGLFLGMAGFLPEIAKDMDEETAIYLAGMQETWGALRVSHGLTPIYGVGDWKLAGTRPANYPMGRLAGLSCFLAENMEGSLETLFRRLLEELSALEAPGQRDAWLTKVSHLFEPSSPGYWAHRHLLGGRRLAKPKALVGRERILLLTLNVVIPFFLARAKYSGNREEERLLRGAAHQLPKPASNWISRYMTRRLMPGKTLRGAMDAVREQGLLQIYADFCMMDQSACAECPLADYLARQEG